MTHDDERFNEYIQRIAREHEPEVEVPREELWRRIDAARRDRRDRGRTGTVIPLARRVRPQRAATWLRWGSALAAMLVLGIAIGRLGPTGRPGTAPMIAAGDSAAPADSAAAMLPYRMAAVQHLDRTEALLASLAADTRGGRTEEVAGWAGDLLTDTRLLLDSPAGSDPDLNKLLVDLELVLAQIADLQAGRAGDEVEMIQDGINQRDVLLRLRAATARPNLAGS
ncbi:MAG TPA: hypothetical protein VK939_14375 [Longimicrobiales bacterium]|nr:hypothetical protein [Longimicrobiales bacterium]